MWFPASPNIKSFGKSVLIYWLGFQYFYSVKLLIILLIKIIILIKKTSKSPWILIQFWNFSFFDILFLCPVSGPIPNNASVPLHQYVSHHSKTALFIHVRCQTLPPTNTNDISLNYRKLNLIYEEIKTKINRVFVAIFRCLNIISSLIICYNSFVKGCFG